MGWSLGGKAQREAKDDGRKEWCVCPRALAVGVVVVVGVGKRQVTVKRLIMIPIFGFVVTLRLTFSKVKETRRRLPAHWQRSNSSNPSLMLSGEGKAAATVALCREDRLPLSGKRDGPGRGPRGGASVVPRIDGAALGPLARGLSQ